MVDSRLWSNKIVPMFAEKWYTGVIGIDKIPDKKVNIKIKSDNKNVEDITIRGWVIKLPTQEAFLPDTLNNQNTLDLLPIKIENTREEDYDKNTYKLITGISTFKVKPEKILSFEEIFDLFKDIKHTNPEDYITYLIILLTQIPLKYNWRMATTGGFGKTNTYNQISSLLPNNKLIKLKSESKIMKESHEKTSLIIDEFTDVSTPVKRELDSFFKITGDGANKIVNPSHGSKAYGTLDEYDISKISYGLFYNTYKDAEEKGLGTVYFDNIYDFPTCQRYFPMYLDGELIAGQFDVSLKEIKQFYEQYEKTYLAFIKSMYYYVENPEEMDLGKEHWVWNDNKVEKLSAERLKGSLRQILIGVKACSKTEKEFQKRCDNIWNSYKRYLDSLDYEEIKTGIFKY